MAVNGYFVSWHGLVTLLSESNYARCQSSSVSNRLCCRGSLEGRSFILLSTPICPQGFCSTVAESVPLHLPQDEHRSCFRMRGCGIDGKRESVRPRLCAAITACVGSPAWFMRICVGARACARTHAGIAPRAVSTARIVFVLRTQRALGL